MSTVPTHIQGLTAKEIGTLRHMMEEAGETPIEPLEVCHCAGALYGADHDADCGYRKG